jgi:hypothetical protein
MRRSGHHAVIVWLARCFERPVYYLNNAVSVANPYVRGFPALTKHQRDLDGFAVEDSLDAFHRAQKDTLFISYEDIDVSRLGRFRLAAGAWRIGAALEQTNMLVIRDPFNLFASRLLDRTRRLKRPTDSRARELWKAHAREAVGQTRNHALRPIVANFNQWFDSAEYRAQLAGRFGLESNEEGVGDVAPWGKGSSSDGVNFQGRAQEMAVARRFTQVLDELDFAELLHDDSLLELSHQLYPELTVEVLDVYARRGKSRE